MTGNRQSFFSESLSSSATEVKILHAAPATPTQAIPSGASALMFGVLKNAPAMLRTHWRPFGVGLSVGCCMALLRLGFGDSGPQRPSSSAKAHLLSDQRRSSGPPLLLASTDAMPVPAATAPLGKWESSNPEPITELALDEIVIRASPVVWKVPAPAPDGPQIEFETRDVLVSGRAVAAVIILKRTGNLSGRVRVRCKTIPGTANPTKDYESQSTIVQFGDRQAMRTLFVPILQQPREGESRTFFVTLERVPRGPSLGTVTSATVTILGDG